jgi:murein DD-endopeptidase MepM/ murein hydrolase activator NlpD
MSWRYITAMSLLYLLTLSILAQPTDEGYTIHVVQRGENLFRIALNYGLTTDELAALNGITSPASIQVGQRLLVPGAAVAGLDGPVTHIVEPGDTLEAIATLYSVPLDTLQANNPNINPTVGQALVIPVATATSAGETGESQVEGGFTASLNIPPATVIHTVQSGETLFRIATQYGLTVNALSAANAISDPTRVFVGQQLIIPGIEPPQFASAFPAPITALYMNPQVLIEGKTSYIQVRAESSVTITTQFLERSLQAVPLADDVYRIFVGVPVFTEPGVYPLELEVLSDLSDETATISANVQIVRGPYGNENIQLIAGRDNLLNTNVEDAESKLLERIVTPFTADRYLQGKMSLPAAAAITSNFGTRRSYNGGAVDRYHSGTDFAGVPGTPILAPAPGRVVLADTLNIRGNATVIEHGWGIYTGYWHQTEIYVGLGDIVETGQIIGTIGSTGRVTGAHLHWELWVNGVAVDPMQWVQQPFVTLE